MEACLQLVSVTRYGSLSTASLNTINTVHTVSRDQTTVEGYIHRIAVPVLEVIELLPVFSPALSLVPSGSPTLSS